MHCARIIGLFSAPSRNSSSAAQQVKIVKIRCALNSQYQQMNCAPQQKHLKISALKLRRHDEVRITPSGRPKGINHCRREELASHTTDCYNRAISAMNARERYQVLGFWPNDVEREVGPFRKKVRHCLTRPKSARDDVLFDPSVAPA